jgi:hypothetical protein
MPKAWKPTFTKISLEQIKNHRAKSLCSKIHKPDESLEVWPLAIKKVDPIYPVPETLRKKYEVETHVMQPEVVEPTHEFQPILPELWQSWMARKIMTQEVLNDHFDYLEAMERRDKVTEALIVLRAEAAALNMQDVLSKISTAGADILDELWSKGGLGD